MSKLFEFHNPSGTTSSSLTTTTIFVGQTFTPAKSHRISSVKIKVFRSDSFQGAGGSPGTVTVSIRATAGGVPTGVDLASGTFDGDTLPTPAANAAYTEAVFSTGVLLVANTKYAIVVRASAADNDNRLGWIMDISSPVYTGGNYVQSNNSGVDWTSQTGWDLAFEEYGGSAGFLWIEGKHLHSTDEDAVERVFVAADAIITYEDEVVSNLGNVVYN
ncbi:hypothetical protein LCGC14_1796450 [marine sediment metagenome]|uniref:Uncharacterized protein n=1 Tax=marine sediment metagenome TaxID=412755 RepID=A0A0F9GQZ3_9ZZZZ